MNYRKLADSEPMQDGDIGICRFDISQGFQYLERSGVRYGREYVGQRADRDGNQKWRAIPSTNWIAYADRAPTKEDGFNGSNAFFPTGSVLAASIKPTALQLTGDRSVCTLLWNEKASYLSHWMPLNLPESKVKPVEIAGRTVTPNKDGSASISCGTEIPKEVVDEFIRQRSEVTGSGK